MPKLPVSIDASSDRMSPKMLPVTTVSNSLGFRSNCIAALSTYLKVTNTSLRLSSALEPRSAEASNDFKGASAGARQ